MRVRDSGQRYAADDLIRCRINDNEQIQAMDGDQNVLRERIVDGVSSAAAQRDVGDELIASRVNDRIDPAMLFGDEDLVLFWGIGEAVGVGDRSGSSYDLECFCIDRRNLVISGHRRIEPMDLRRDGSSGRTIGDSGNYWGSSYGWSCYGSVADFRVL
jgi:hypothetical protein